MTYSYKRLLKSARSQKSRQRLRNLRRNREFRLERLEDRNLLAGDLGLPEIHAEGEGGVVCPQLTATQLRTARLTHEVATNCAAQLYASAFAPELPRTSQAAGEDGRPSLTKINAVEDINLSNDGPATAQPLPLGFGASEDAEVDISGQLQADDAIDVYSFDLNPGDIVGFNIVGAALTGSMLGPTTDEIVTSSQDNVMGLYPGDSPLPLGGNAADAFVATVSGTHYFQVSDFDPSITGGAYTAELRIFRPVLENNPVGTRQILFLDFNGATVDTAIFGATGIASLSPLSSFLPDFNLSAVEEDALIDAIIETVQDDFDQIRQTGNNGDFLATGNAGDYDIEILNSRDHSDPFGQPNVSRMIVGGTAGELGLGGILGIAQSVDIGNFDTTETAVTLLDALSGRTGGGGADDVNTVILAPGASRIEMIGRVVGATITHEAGHYFGLYHTEPPPTNTVRSLIDNGSPGATVDSGAGPDGIYGNLDDDNPSLVADNLDPAEGHTGFQDVPNVIANVLPTGTIASTIRGIKYHDLDTDGVRDINEPGLPGFQIFVDLNNNGLVDPREPNDITGADGSYALTVPPGQYVIREVVPPGWTLTAPASGFHSVRVNFLGQEITGIDFGNSSDLSGISGTKFNDLDNDGVFDADEPTVPGIFIYLDLDNDNRLDLNEPVAETDDEGNYSISVPTSGTYTVRELIPPGWTLTFPTNDEGEHTLFVESGQAVPGVNFGNHAAVDFGDAPDPYPTLDANSGAKHNIKSGFHLGSGVDGEGDGAPTVGAIGDDANTTANDEDGIVFTSPIFPGSTSTLNVTFESGDMSPGFVNGWMDFNLDGDWDDAGEQIVTDFRNVDGTYELTFTVPEDAMSGETYARFRYGYGRGMKPTGMNPVGEVEDYFTRVLSEDPEARDDVFDVTQGDSGVPLDVLANDIPSLAGPLSIAAVSSTTSGGTVIIVGGTSISYTAPAGFAGNDSFSYTVQDSQGNSDSADVSITILPSLVDPIAVDDSFTVNPGTTNNVLNVLANDLTGQRPPVTIISLSAPSGGTASLDDRGTAGPEDDVIRYTPTGNLTEPDQFVYTIQDSTGVQSTATVTVHVNDAADDIVRIRLQATDLQGNPITELPVGEQFNLQVWTADDLRDDDGDGDDGANNFGVSGAYLDILYQFNLVARTDDPIVSGPEFENAVSFSAGVPGLFDEVGAFQTNSSRPPRLTNDPAGGRGRVCQSDGPGGTCDETLNEVLVMTIPLRGTAVGDVDFIADPADRRTDLVTPTNNLIPDHDVLVFNPSAGTRGEHIIPFDQVRYEGTSLSIIGAGSRPQAVDNIFHVAANSTNNVFEVLENDIVPTNPPLTISGIGPGPDGVPLQGAATISTDGKTILYTPRTGFVGTEQLTYTVRNANNSQAPAPGIVTVQVGNSPADINIRLEVTDVDGTPVSSVAAGSEFQVRGYVKDIRTSPPDPTRTGVFAIYFDLLYNSNLVSTVSDPLNRFGFDIEFASPYAVNGLSANNSFINIVDEVGAFQDGNSALGSGEFLVFTLQMQAEAIGTADFFADPADLAPFHDSLLFEPPGTVADSRINYGVASVEITTAGGAAAGEGEFHNRLRPTDVNGDDETSPIDALLVINDLNINGSRNLFATGGLAEGEHSQEHYFLDVSGDNFASPLDGLIIINHLNQRSFPNGEGEANLTDAVVLTTNVPSTSSVSLAIDVGPIEVDQPLSQQESTVVAAAEASSLNNDAVDAYYTADDEDGVAISHDALQQDELEDLFELFARDEA